LEFYHFDVKLADEIKVLLNSVNLELELECLDVYIIVF
jgi:hypothetical protein